MRMLSSSSPVTAITRSARSMPARSSTHSSDPSPYCAACSSSSSTTAKRDWSDSTTVSSLPLSISSRARFQPTFPAPTTTTYIRCSLPRPGAFGGAKTELAKDAGRSHWWLPMTSPRTLAERRFAAPSGGAWVGERTSSYAASSTACSSSAIAIFVGQTVFSPCCSYHAARAGSSTRTTTLSTRKRFCAIWAITRFVLSPSVDATKASARSMPASISASISRAVPTVNEPPCSSQLRSDPFSRCAIASGSSSRTETSCPSESILRATAEPTRPEPTIITNIAAHSTYRNGSWSGFPLPLRGRARAVPVARGRRREYHPAGGLLHNVTGDLADRPVARSAAPAEQRPAPHARRRLGGEHDRLHPAALGLGHDRGAHRAGAHHRRRDHHPLVLLTHLLRAPHRSLRARDLLVRHACVERQRHRHLHDVERLDHRAALALLALLGRQASCRADDVVVELVAEHRNEDAAVLGLGHVLQRGGRDREARAQRLVLAAPVDDVQDDPEDQPDAADVAR